MNHITFPRRSVRFSTVTVLLLVASSLGSVPASSQGNPGEVGEVLWPTEAHRNHQDLADLGASFFNDTADPLTIGLAPVESLEAEQINATTTRLTAHESGGQNLSFVQHHDPWDGDGHTVLAVRPARLLTMVGIRMETDRYARSVLTLTGPPGSFDLNGGTVGEKVQAFAQRLDFPADENVTLDHNPSGFPGLFDRACYDKANGNCTVSASFEIACPSCTFATFGPPSGNSSQDSALAGIGLALFDDQDRMIAATVQYIFDVDESAVLDLETARDRAADDLRDRGYDIVGAPDPEDIRSVMGVLAPTRVDVQEIHYKWHFGVYESGSDVSAAKGADVVQNAVTGKVVSVSLSPGDVREPPTGWGFPIPAAETVLVLAALGIAAATAPALAWRRRD